MDKNDDGRMTIEELQDGITPKYFQSQVIQKNFQNKVNDTPQRLKISKSGSAENNQQKQQYQKQKQQQQQQQPQQQQSILKKQQNQELDQSNSNNNNSAQLSQRYLTPSKRQNFLFDPVRVNPQTTNSSQKKQSNHQKKYSEVLYRGTTSNNNTSINQSYKMSPQKQTLYSINLLKSETEQRMQNLERSFSRSRSPQKSINQSGYKNHQLPTDSPYKTLQYQTKNIEQQLLRPTQYTNERNDDDSKQLYNSSSKKYQQTTQASPSLYLSRQYQQQSNNSGVNRGYSPSKQLYVQQQQNNEKVELLMMKFKQIINLEKDIEKAKDQLALRPDFNLIDFFSLFDKNKKGFTTTNEIEPILEELMIKYKPHELYLFLRRFDTLNNGKLKFSQFGDAFTPFQREYAELLTQRKSIIDDQANNIFELLSQETRKLLSQLLIKYFESEMIIEDIRKELKENLKVNLHEAFDYLDTDSNGLLTLKEIKLAFEKFNIYSTEKDIQFLIERFNVNKNGRITFAEFVQELTPKLSFAF